MSGKISYANPPGARSKPSLYSHVSIVSAGNLAFIAGQVSACAGHRDDEFALQFAEVFEAIGSILKDLGTDFEAVAEFTTYLVDADHVQRFRELRNALFPALFQGDGYPPNTLLVVRRLGNPEWLIEVKTVVRLPD